MALDFVKEELEKIIVSREGVFAYGFKVEDGKVVEEKRKAVRLRKNSHRAI